MTWDEMIAKLRADVVPEDNIPSRAPKEANYGLRKEGPRFVVFLTERGETTDLADFPSEHSAVDYIYDRMVIDHRLHGDKRFEKWAANPSIEPSPTAEDFGGRSLRKEPGQ